MANIDTRNLNALAGAVYFTVGRGTEGGSASYRLSVAGVSNSEWGQVSAVAANSGYSIGTIQVDLGQRGTWPLGATESRALRPGETTYVDGIIAQASAYARAHNLPFPRDTADLRADLLSHGDGGVTRGGSRRSSISFIDASTRDTINAWAGSEQGKQWIHEKVDYPQVRSATETALNIVNTHGRNISEDRRFEAINILAKTANQYPGGLDRLQTVLRNGGDYDALLDEAKAIQGRVSYYAGPKAASVAEGYENNYNNPARQPAMDRAHARVSSANYNPANERNDPDVSAALAALPSGAPRRAAANTVLELGESGREVRKLESNLAGLGINDNQSRPLTVDGNFSAETKQAVENYQRGARLEPVDGRAGPQTLGSIDQTVRGLQQNLTTLEITRANGQPVGVDGYYGDGTREAVVKFQQTHGINPSGIADEATRTAIDAAVRERTQGQTQTQPQPGAQTTQPQPAQTAPSQPAPAQTQPGQATQPAPAEQANGPRSFNEVMRVMLPPQNGVNPHMTSDFGPRTLNGKPDDHGGVDFNYVGGQSGINLRHPTVHSPVSGTVVFSGGGYNTVGIRDDQGNVHQILHLDSRSVQVTNPPTRVQAGDPIGTMGGEVPGNRDIAQHVHYQLRDPNNRIIDPEAYWNNQQRAQGPAAPAADPLSDGRLQRNERGEPVRALQQNLETLGVQFHDARGQRIAATGFYGQQTETAVRDFQRSHQLDPTGVADAATRQAIETAARERTQAAPTRAVPGEQPHSHSHEHPHPQAPAANPQQPGNQTRPVPGNVGGPELLTNPQNPNNPLFNQILGKVHEAERARGIPPGDHSRNLAAALTVEAVRERITQPERVELSRDGSLARVVQLSAMGDRPELNRATDGIGTQQAVQQSVRESSEQATQVSNNVRAQDANDQRQREERPEKAMSQ